MPAYTVKVYMQNEYKNFNDTAYKIMRITNTTENMMNSLKSFFENKFIRSICGTSTGRSMIGSLCDFINPEISKRFINDNHLCNTVCAKYKTLINYDQEVIEHICQSFC